MKNSKKKIETNINKQEKSSSNDYIQSKFEEIIEKNKSPENYYTSFFSIYLNLRRLWKEYEKENTELSSKDIFNYFTNENFKKNKHTFRLFFRNYERKFQTSVFFNQQIIVEKVYSNPKIQAFFEYVLLSPDINTDSFSLEFLFSRFVNEFWNDFSLIIDEIKATVTLQREAEIKTLPDTLQSSGIGNLENSPFLRQAIKKLGRKESFVDNKGKLQAIKPHIKRAVEFLNMGKTGNFIFEELYPIKEYKNKISKRTRNKTNLTNILRYHYKNHPEFFNRPFDASAFKKGS